MVQAEPSTSRQGSMYTSRDDVDTIVNTLHSTFSTNRTKDLRFRKWQLKQMYWMIEDNEAEIVAALYEDLHRHEFESRITDISALKTDILEHIKHLEAWTAEIKPNAGLVFTKVGSVTIRKEPLGLVLIIGAWNFPFALSLSPLIAAIAAGCTAIVKPSELAKATEKLISQLVPRYMDPESYAVVTGGPEETGYLLTKKFDHIFFTGSASIARHISKAAAINLTPVTLELGGQGPAIVTKHADVDLAAKRIAMAKFMNAGQICLSVNHVFVDPEVHKEFANRIKFWTTHFGSENEGYMSSIVNERHFDRLQDLLDRTKGEILVNGSNNKEKLRFKSTVIDNINMDDALMESELFGPLLPVVVADYQEACRVTSTLPHPLAIYIFSNDKAEIDYVLNNTISGGVTINDCMLHASVPGAPFGGVGESGQGAYHGSHGVDTFTHKRVVASMPNWLDRFMGFRYPPYDLKDVDKVAPKKKVGFTRGEKLTDQKIKHPGSNKTMIGAMLASIATLVFYRNR